jgi:TolA-binding protein
VSITKPLLVGLGLLALVGCDTAEQAAGSFAKKVEEAAVEQARESLGDTIKQFDEQVDQLNEKVDQAQENTRQWLDQAQPQPDQEREQEQPQREAEQQPSPEMIET